MWYCGTRSSQAIVPLPVIDALTHQRVIQQKPQYSIHLCDEAGSRIRIVTRVKRRNLVDIMPGGVGE